MQRWIETRVEPEILAVRIGRDSFEALMHKGRLIRIFEQAHGIDGDVRAIERAHHRIVVAAVADEHSAADLLARLVDAEGEEDDFFAGANAAQTFAEKP